MAAPPIKLPQRTCISCRTGSGKRELVRIVRGPEGGAEIDLTGKKPGRGAYLCRRPECWQEAIKRGRLETPLRTKLRTEDRAQLTEFTEGLTQAKIV